LLDLGEDLRLFCVLYKLTISFFSLRGCFFNAKKSVFFSKGKKEGTVHKASAKKSGRVFAKKFSAFSLVGNSVCLKNRTWLL